MSIDEPFGAIPGDRVTVRSELLEIFDAPGQVIGQTSQELRVELDDGRDVWVHRASVRLVYP